MLKINGKITDIKLKKIENYILGDNKNNLDIVEIFGVDGAGKSYLASKIIRKILTQKIPIPRIKTTQVQLLLPYSNFIKLSQ